MNTEQVEAILREISVPEALFPRLLPQIQEALEQSGATPTMEVLTDVSYYFAFTDPAVRRAVNYRHPLDTFR